MCRKEYNINLCSACRRQNRTTECQWQNTIQCHSGMPFYVLLVLFANVQVHLVTTTISVKRRQSVFCDLNCAFSARSLLIFLWLLYEQTVVIHTVECNSMSCLAYSHSQRDIACMICKSQNLTQRRETIRVVNIAIQVSLSLVSAIHLEYRHEYCQYFLQQASLTVSPILFQPKLRY